MTILNSNKNKNGNFLDPIKKNLFSWEFFENDTKFHKKRRGRPVPSVNP